MYHIGSKFQERVIALSLSCENMAGKKGVPNLRKRLDKIQSFNLKMERRNFPSSPGSPARMMHLDYWFNLKKTITPLLEVDHSLLTRGPYEQLIFNQQLITSQGLNSCSFPEKHPALWGKAKKILRKAQEAELLPFEESNWDDKGRGSQVSIDFYGIQGKIILVQVRESERRFKKSYLNVKKSYFITGGSSCYEVSSKLVHNAIKISSDIDSPLRYIAQKDQFLACKFDLKTGEEKMKLPSRPKEIRLAKKKQLKAWKAVAVVHEKFYSIFDGSFPWPVGQWIEQKIRWEKGQDHPFEGLYCYMGKERAERFGSQSGKYYKVVRVLCKQWRIVSSETTKIVASKMMILP